MALSIILYTINKGLFFYDSLFSLHEVDITLVFYLKLHFNFVFATELNLMFVMNNLA